MRRDGLRALTIGAAIAVLLTFIGWLDLSTGYNLQFFVFYFLPISLAAWHMGRVAGLLAAGLCAAIWIFADVQSGHVYSDPTFLYWNGGIRLIAFLVIAVTLAQLRATITAERALRAKVQLALSEVRQLRGMLPICSSCKRIRNDEGAWEQIELYVRSHSDAEFTHGLCPECVRTLYPEMADRLLSRSKPA
jgi:hypothetical protein